MKHEKRCIKVHSGKYSAWYMKAIWKIHYKFPDAKINLRDSTTRSFSHVTALFISYMAAYIFCLIVLQTFLFSANNPHVLYSRSAGEELIVILF